MNTNDCRLDLHTHSIISYDGGLSAKDYARLLGRGILDCVAITDHNETRFARQLHEKLGNKIIIGEEIMTSDGEVIGLYLQQTIPPGLTAEQTIKQIHEQNGLVYIPHPFETLRKGVQIAILQKVVEEVDIIEVFNGRAMFRGRSKQAEEFANEQHIPGAASSDAHCYSGVGRTFSLVNELPTKATLKQLLKG